jgi:NADH-quinone oxidoreductase subunit E
MRVQRTERSTVTPDEPVIAVDLDLLMPLIDKYKSKKGNMIPLLQGTQNLYGFIPEAALTMISERTGLNISDMYGVTTFYAQFRLKPAGKIVIKVCHGTACHVQNANMISEAIEEALQIKDGETTVDRLFTLESVACLGCCSLAPVMMIGDESYGKLTGKSAVQVVKEIKIRES